MLRNGEYKVNVNGSALVYSLKVPAALMSKILACKSIDVDLAEGTLVVGAHSVAIEQKPLDIPIDLFRANDNNLSLVGSLAKRLQITPSAVEGETYREMAAVDQAKREGRRAVLLETPITTKAGANGRRRLNRVPVGPSRSISSISKPSIADPAKQNPRMSSPMESSKPKRTLASTTKKPVLFKSNESLRRDLIHILAISPLAIPELEKRLGKREPEIRLDLSSLAKIFASDPSKYQLKNASYQDLDVWNYKYLEHERESAVKNARLAFDALGLPEDANARSRLTRVLAPGELKSSESDSFPSSSTNSDHVPTADHPAPLPQKDYSLIKDDQWESLDAKDLNGLEKHQQSRLETMHARLLVLKKQAGIIRDICARGGDLPEILACLDKDLASFSPDDFFQLVSRLNKDYLDLAEAHTKVKVHQMQLSDTK